ncbi:hypothetical protein ART_3048 [Arthrobacter sp. PAMC 25486]|uniref:NAD-dependent epimerase/dehydratase family protein n=1 Tax=Arthrobacter sp. PAMC 25486 TaxID=1494608 RepID=UPI000535D324|nr:NAD(P)-dependent oxidoreductase [Arthrobacter sp. PAMC 25486]AIY02647.1 hypothetical protein ART_3048 [Arthrobacter sp. PAMC 25486]
MTTDSPAPPPSVLITGATGFLGGYAVSEFLAQGYKVVAHGRNPAALERLRGMGATTVAGDLAQLAHMKQPVDVVVHAAALSSPWGKWGDFKDSNVAGTRHVVSFMERNAVPRLVFVSSPSIYAGRGDKLAIRETRPIRSKPLSSYIRSKIAAEAFLQEAHSSGRLPELLTIRPRGIIGAGDPSVAPRLLQAYRKIGVPLFRGGENLVDLTAVENVALALRLAAAAPSANGQVYNITNGQPRPFKELLEILFKKLDLPPRYLKANATVFYGLGALLEGICHVVPGRPEPPLSRYMVSTIAYSQTLDITRARAELGYEPRVDIEQALAAFATEYSKDHA